MSFFQKTSPCKPTPAPQIVLQAYVRPSRNTPRASGVWTRNSARRSPRGACLPWWTPSRPCGGCRARWPSPWWRTLGTDPLRAPQRTDAIPGVSPVRICLWPAAPTGRDDENWQHPCPPRAGRRRLGVSLSREGQPPVTTAPRTPTPSMQDISWKAHVRLCNAPTPGGQGHTRPCRDRGHGACNWSVSCGPLPRRFLSPCKVPQTTWRPRPRVEHRETMGQWA